MDSTNKQFVVRQFKGIEEIVVNQTGSGYDDEIPPTIIIDGDGEAAALSSSCKFYRINCQCQYYKFRVGYTKDPRVILSHPQIFKKADYYVALIQNENYVKINDVYINDEKELSSVVKLLILMGMKLHLFSKFSELGVKEWEKD